MVAESVMNLSVNLRHDYSVRGRLPDSRFNRSSSFSRSRLTSSSVRRNQPWFRSTFSIRNRGPGLASQPVGLVGSLALADILSDAGIHVKHGFLA